MSSTLLLYPKELDELRDAQDELRGETVQHAFPHPVLVLGGQTQYGFPLHVDLPHANHTGWADPGADCKRMPFVSANVTVDKISKTFEDVDFRRL